MINDKIVPFEEIDGAYMDRGTFFGDGVYDVLRSYEGRIFAIDEHMARFSHSLEAIDIDGVDVGQIRRRIQEAYLRSAIPNARIYLHITRGSAPRKHTWEHLKPNFMLMITELPDYEQQKKDGVAVMTHPDLRWKRCDIKSLNLLANVMAKQKAHENDCDEAVLVDENALITEGSSSAFFAVTGQSLQTSPLTANILASVTRDFVIKAAREISLPVIEESLTLERATGADELFMAATSRDVLGVVKFDGITIGSGKPGPVTKTIARKFLDFAMPKAKRYHEIAESSQNNLSRSTLTSEKL